MRIESFEFESTQKRWKLSRTKFADLTLLVGVSGVGKTRILRSLASLSELVEGNSKPGIKWSVEFSDENARRCEWSGEFERLKDWEDLSAEFEFMVSTDDEEAPKKKARILWEEIRVDGEELISRRDDRIIFNGLPTPKLSPNESVIHLLKEEDIVRPIAKSFSRVYYTDRAYNDSFSGRFAAFNSEKLVKKFTDIEAVKQSSHSALAKLFLAYNLKDRSFDEVEARFIGVFPSVEKVSFASLKDGDGASFFGNVAFVEIREVGVEGSIPQKDISSGMMRTLSHLAELYLSPRGTVILIDEFENSLGVNCINAVTEDLLDSSNSIQFIITSHHPYIINNISPNYWKVVGRIGNEVHAVDASSLDIGASSHDAFLQLINHAVYIQGIDVSVKG